MTSRNLFYSEGARLIREMIRAAGREIADLLYPRRCPFCHEIVPDFDALICPDCRQFVRTHYL
ncbi:MAG: double zinc ribbon domain-containing protein, partial [Lachnospiraceae bacterium]